MKNGVIILVLVFFAMLVVSIVSPNVQNVSPIVTLAIADQEEVRMARYDNLELSLDGERYTLYLQDISWDRKSASFLIKSDPESGAPFIHEYFRLDFGWKAASMYKQPEQFLVFPDQSKIVYMGNGKELYIKLVSIESREANLIVKWI